MTKEQKEQLDYQERRVKMDRKGIKVLLDNKAFPEHQYVKYYKTAFHSIIHSMLLQGSQGNPGDRGSPGDIGALVNKNKNIKI